MRLSYGAISGRPAAQGPSQHIKPLKGIAASLRIE